MLLQKPVHREVIAEDTHAAARCTDASRNSVQYPFFLGDGCEKIESNGGFDRGGLLISKCCVEEEVRRWRRHALSCFSGRRESPRLNGSTHSSFCGARVS